MRTIDSREMKTMNLQKILFDEDLSITPKGVIYDRFDREEGLEDSFYNFPVRKYMTLKNVIFSAHILNNMDYQGIVIKTELPALIKIINHILPEEKPTMVKRVAVTLKTISNYWWIFYGIGEG